MSLNNDCEKIQDSLSAYIDNEDVDKALVDSHLSACPHCNEVLQKLNDSKNLLLSLAPSVPQKDFTSELEKQLVKTGGNNVIQGSFSKMAVAAIFIALTGLVGFYAISNSHQQEVAKTIAVAPLENTEPIKKIEKQKDKIVTQPLVKVALKETVKHEPILKKENEIKVQISKINKDQSPSVQIQSQSQSQTQPVVETPVIALNTNDLSNENGLFDEMGFGSDEDGLYAIKL
jgi:hypothetical protein